MHECPICLENLFREVTCSLKCGHVFHYQCIKNQEDSLPRYQDGSPNYQHYHCPLCRISINPWAGDVTILNGLIDENYTNIVNLEYGIEIMSNFEIKNINILNQRVKNYLSDLKSVKKEIELGNKELQNLSTLKGKIYEEVEKTSKIFKKNMLKFIDKYRKEINKLKEERERIEQQNSELLKKGELERVKIEQDNLQLIRKKKEESQKIKERTQEEIEKMKEKFRKEIKIFSESQMEVVKKEKKLIKEFNDKLIVNNEL